MLFFSKSIAVSIMMMFLSLPHIIRIVFLFCVFIGLSKPDIWLSFSSHSISFSCISVKPGVVWGMAQRGTKDNHDLRFSGDFHHSHLEKPVSCARGHSCVQSHPYSLKHLTASIFSLNALPLPLVKNWKRSSSLACVVVWENLSVLCIQSWILFYFFYFCLQHAFDTSTSTK